MATALAQDGVGRSYGAQLLLRAAPWHGLSGWLSYTGGRSERRDHPTSAWRLFDYDQTHILTLLGEYAFRRWSFGARFRWATGFPRTPVVGSYFDARDDRYDPLFGAQNGIRIADFVQLDVRAEYAFVWSRAALAPLPRRAERDLSAQRRGDGVQRRLGAARRHHRLADAGRGRRAGDVLKRALLTLLVAASAGCQPDFGPSLSHVTAPRVAAVRFDPAEAAPGASVTATAFVVDSGRRGDAADRLVAVPRAQGDDGQRRRRSGVPRSRAARCSRRRPTAPAPLTLPPMGCRLFGPDAPPQMPGEPPLQSRAPDVTGGYYQPVRADLDGAPAIGLARIRCALSGASFDVAAEYAATYVSNRNPSLTPLAAFVDGAPVALDAIPAGRVVTLAAGWSDDSPESFPVLDVLSQTLVTHREAMTVSWLASDGVLAAANTGRAEDDPALFTTTTWTAPPTAGTVHLFVVLRDSRGGVDFAAYDAIVR